MVDCQFIPIMYRDSDLLASGFPIGKNPTLRVMKDEDRSPFGLRLRTARNHAKLSQKSLAEQVGLVQGTIAEHEASGQGTAVTAKIAEVCGVRVEWLADGEGPMLPEPVKKKES